MSYMQENVFARESMLCKSTDKKQLSLSDATALSSDSKRKKEREREEEATSGGLILPVSALRVKGRICLREISLNHVPSLFLVLLILHVSGHAWRRDGSVWPDGYSNSAVWFEAPSFILCSLTVLT